MKRATQPKANWTLAFPDQLRPLAKKAMKLRRQIRVNAISEQRRMQSAEYSKLKLTWWKEPRNRCCVLTGKRDNLDLHHPWGRSKRLLCLTRLWLAVNRDVHEWIRENVILARILGLYSPAGRYNDYPSERDIQLSQWRVTCCEWFALVRDGRLNYGPCPDINAFNPAISPDEKQAIAKEVREVFRVYNIPDKNYTRS